MPVKDETGNRYGRLLVLKRVENHPTRGDAQWLCKCDCGNEKIIRGVQLRSGKSKSCGCLQKEKVREQGLKNTEDLIGKRFGRLTVRERIDGTESLRGKWICDCDCGGFTITTTDKLKSGHSQSCGCLQSKGELRIAQLLQKNNIVFSKEYSFPGLKRRNVLRFDFALFFGNSLKCLVEFDGEQHYNKDSIFYSDELAENDIAKNKWCKDNSLKLYRVRYDDNIDIEMEKIINDNFR